MPTFEWLVDGGLQYIQWGSHRWTGEGCNAFHFALKLTGLNSCPQVLGFCVVVRQCREAANSWLFHAESTCAHICWFIPFTASRSFYLLTLLMQSCNCDCLQFGLFGDAACWHDAGNPHPLAVPLLDTCPTCVIWCPYPLLGVVPILDPFGETLLVAVTVQGECAVVEVKLQPAIANPLYIEGAKQNHCDHWTLEAIVFQMMSKELLRGPVDIPISQVLRLVSTHTSWLSLWKCWWNIWCSSSSCTVILVEGLHVRYCYLSVGYIIRYASYCGYNWRTHIFYMTSASCLVRST
jgi:hypothetical protein